jgi:hypothetical protein
MVLFIAGVVLLLGFVFLLLNKTANKNKEEWLRMLQLDARYELAERKRQWLMMAAILGLSQAEAENSFQAKVRLEGIGIFVKLNSWLPLGSGRTTAEKF